MIFVDSNIPMYLVGGKHSHQADARRALERAVTAGDRLVTDAEVYQEILHRYRAIDRPDAIGPCFRVLNDIVEDVFPIQHGDMVAASQILLSHWALSARDALHVAVMRDREVSRILSYDQGFDVVPGLERIG